MQYSESMSNQDITSHEDYRSDENSAMSENDTLYENMEGSIHVIKNDIKGTDGQKHKTNLEETTGTEQ